MAFKSWQSVYIHDLSQSLATAITFSTARHSDVNSFPVINIHPRGFDIIINVIVNSTF